MVKKFKDYPNFTPDFTPKEMFQQGVFGGTYFRDIHSNVTNKDHTNAKEEFPKSWFKGVVVDSQICNKELNKYKTTSGTSLRFWEEKGWITSQDPYGWVQWYCRFYQGRRSPDDLRQIKRWEAIAGPDGRFKKWLNTIRKNGKDSPKIKQLLLQWAVSN